MTISPACESASVAPPASGADRSSVATDDRVKMSLTGTGTIANASIIGDNVLVCMNIICPL